MTSTTNTDKCDDPVIQISSVTKAFTSRRVLKGIDLTVGSKESVFICGINGAGKSTLLLIIAGLLEPDEGNVLLCGHSIKTDPDLAKSNLGVISHKAMVYPDLTVLENLTFFATLYGVKDHEKRINELLADLNLSSFRYDRAAILSRGLLQRLAIARALVHDPAILLADEPFTGLDAESCRHLRNVLKTFAENGGTVMMTTHDANLGLHCATRVVVLDGCNLVFDEKTENVNAVDFTNDYLSYARGAR